MRFETVNRIKNEIIEIVMSYYCKRIIEINNEPEIGQLEKIIEIVSFVFEKDRLKFDEIVKRQNKEVTEDEMNIERMLFVSWTSLEILTEIRYTERRSGLEKYYSGIIECCSIYPK